MKIKITFFLISLCLFLFNLTGCGLDNYIVIDSPTNIIHQPVYTSLFDESYFEFETKEDSDAMFLGTDVYYKIYSNYALLTQEVDALQTRANSTSTSATVPDYLITNYKYKTLKATNYKDSPLIKKNSAGKNQTVYIRLTNYFDSEDFSARITTSIDGKKSYLGNSADKTAPLRFTDDLTFDFGRNKIDSKINKIPVTGTDEDVSTSTTITKENEWYVAMFAIGVARDVTYTNIYSNILYLGCVTIKADEENN